MDMRVGPVRVSINHARDVGLSVLCVEVSGGYLAATGGDELNFGFGCGGRLNAGEKDRDGTEAEELVMRRGELVDLHGNLLK